MLTPDDMEAMQDLAGSIAQPINEYIIKDICRRVKAKTVTKGKSMITEEINLNEFLEAQGVEPVETDLGEYIIQLRGEHPSHIIAPAVHLNKEQVEEEANATELLEKAKIIGDQPNAAMFMLRGNQRSTLGKNASTPETISRITAVSRLMLSDELDVMMVKMPLMLLLSAE